ncbi:MAG: trypsin-like peptidase domain-containing protein [Phycisphaerales bacterium]|nr:trypsin-like peptidase domain-containing protein [Phycisphaerales bacterium]
MSLFTTAFFTAATLFSTAVAAPNDAASAGAEYRAVLDVATPSLVTVKFVLKVSGPRGTQDVEREITATMIDKSGLILCAGVQLGTSKLYRRMGSVTPTDIKILIGDDTVGIDAKLIATDAELDLAWIRVKDATKLPANVNVADYSKPQTASLGDRVFSVKRMEKFFDRAPVVMEGRIAGETKKPREMLVGGAGLDLEPGMPVFAANGMVIGVAVFQAPDPEDMEGAGGSNATLILPTEQLNKATQRALAAAAEEAEEEDDSGITPPPTAEKKTDAPAKEDEE